MSFFIFLEKAKKATKCLIEGCCCSNESVKGNPARISCIYNQKQISQKKKEIKKQQLLEFRNKLFLFSFICIQFKLQDHLQLFICDLFNYFIWVRTWSGIKNVKLTDIYFLKHTILVSTVFCFKMWRIEMLFKFAEIFYFRQPF